MESARLRLPLTRDERESSSALIYRLSRLKGSHRRILMLHIFLAEQRRSQPHLMPHDLVYFYNGTKSGNRADGRRASSLMSSCIRLKARPPPSVA